ncbi:MAG: cyclic nucleotide-binding domain-containing protein [Fibrobacterales bacterium]
MIDVTNLKNYSLFGGLRVDQMEIILNVLTEKSFEPGHDIVTQGERSERVYMIIEGSVSVYVDGEKIAVLHEGESFGEMHLIDIMPRSATITADTDVTTVSICNKDIISVKQSSIDTYLMMIMNCARNISRRLRTTNKAYAALIKKNNTFNC